MQQQQEQHEPQRTSAQNDFDKNTADTTAKT